MGRLVQCIYDPTDRPVGHAACTGGGHHALGVGGGTIRGRSPVDDMWRQWWAKLELEEGEAPSIVREAQAHRSSDVTWGRGGAAAWQNFRVVGDLSPSAVASWCSYSTEGKKGSLDSEGSTRKWLADGAHRSGSSAVVAALILMQEGFSVEPEWTRSHRGGVGGLGALRSRRRKENSKFCACWGKKAQSRVPLQLKLRGGGGSGPWCQGEEGEGGGPSGMGTMCGGGGWSRQPAEAPSRQKR
jgi:hypothetical protein